VTGLGDQDAAEPAGVTAARAGVASRGVTSRAVISRGEELKLVEALKVEREAARGPVELDPQPVLAPGGAPGDLEGAERTGGEPRGEHDRVVHRHRAGARAAGVRPLGGERRAERRHPGDLVAGQVAGQVDDVRAQVAERTGPGPLGLHPPGHRRAGVSKPVLQVNGAEVAQGTEAALLDEAPGQGERGHAPVVEAHHGPGARRVGRVGGRLHRLGFREGVGEGLLAQHVLARGEGGDRDRRVRVAGRGDVDELDVVAGDQRPPVRLDRPPAEPLRRRPRGGLVPAADGGEPRPQREVEGTAHRVPGERVGPAHERVADHADADGVRGVSWL
jgi:hypothetical protein